MAKENSAGAAGRLPCSAGLRAGPENWECLYPGRCHVVPHLDSSDNT